MSKKTEGMQAIKKLQFSRQKNQLVNHLVHGKYPLGRLPPTLTLTQRRICWGAIFRSRNHLITSSKTIGLIISEIKYSMQELQPIHKKIKQKQNTSER